MIDKELLLNLIREGDIILVHKLGPIKKPGDIVAPVIRHVTKCFYNHAAIVGTACGELFIYEAIEKGFYPTISLNKYLDTIGVEREILVKRRKQPLQLDVLRLRTMNEIGKKYDFSSTLLFQLWYNYTGQWKGPRSESQREKAVNCSEVVGYINYDIFPDAYKVAPVHIYDENNYLETVYESAIEKRMLFDVKYQNS